MSWRKRDFNFDKQDQEFKEFKKHWQSNYSSNIMHTSCPSPALGVNSPGSNLTVPPYSHTVWPSHILEGDAFTPGYINQLTDAVIALQDIVNGLRDREQALLERIEMLEDDIAR